MRVAKDMDRALGDTIPKFGKQESGDTVGLTSVAFGIGGHPTKIEEGGIISVGGGIVGGGEASHRFFVEAQNILFHASENSTAPATG